MSQKTLAGKTVEVTDEGYLQDHNQWNEDIAKALAEEEGIELGEDHFKILHYLREKYEEGANLTIRKVGKSGFTDIKGFYKLFPGGPLKKASKIAGIPKPTSCV